MLNGEKGLGLEEQMTNIPTTVNVPTVASTESWLKVHERLLIVIIFSLVAVFSLDKSLGIVQQWDQHKANEAQQQLSIDAQKSKDDLDKAEQLLTVYQNTQAQSNALNQKLIQEQTLRDKQLDQQQQKDLNLSPDQLSLRWETLIGKSGVTVTNGMYTVQPEVAVDTVQQLEYVPILRQDLSDEQTKSANLQKDVDAANNLVDQGKTAVNGLQLQIKDQTTACSTQVAALKAGERKSKLKTFFIGFGIGFIAGATAHAW